jgi:hypothetical protein
MMNYWYKDIEDGECFFVQENDAEKAAAIARTVCDFPLLLDIVSDIEAEIMGFDTY